MFWDMPFASRSQLMISTFSLRVFVGTRRMFYVFKHAGKKCLNLEKYSKIACIDALYSIPFAAFWLMHFRLSLPTPLHTDTAR